MSMTASRLPIGHPSFFTAFVAFGIFVPFIASVALAFSYAWSGNYNWAWQYTALLVSMIWLAASVILRSFTTADRAQQSSFLSFTTRFDALIAAMSSVQMASVDCGADETRRAIGEAQAHVDGILAQLSPAAAQDNRHLSVRNLQWLTGDGYIGLWEGLQRAEEALIPALPVHEIISAANFEDSRIRESGIRDEAALREQLQAAISVLQQAARLSPSWSFGRQEPSHTPPPTSTSEKLEPTAVEIRAARQRVKAVRQAVNEYREGRRAALIGARNRLYATVFVTSVFLFLAVLLTVVVASSGASKEPIKNGLVAGVAFFVIGGTAGLFSRLYADAGSDNESRAGVDDYGLSTAKLLHAAVLSGLAGVIGAAVLPILGALGNDTVELPQLHEIFSLEDNISGLLFAALFGVAPSALIGRLQQEADRYKSDLAKSEATASTG
ncbi:MAG: hypothetical protein AB7I38_10415 [Dehalococcoidia bacterium]